MKLAKKFGWLPIGQAAVVALSLLGFALLARFLGPEPYARFAVVLFFYTATSLLVDLSPHAFAIVAGFRPGLLRVITKVSAISSAAGVVLLIASAFVANTFFLEAPIGLFELLLIQLALVTQTMMQVPRSVLVLKARYRSMVMVDVSGAVVGLVVALVIASQVNSSLALVAQMSVTAVFRFVASCLLVLDRSSREPLIELPTRGLSSSLVYGLRVAPLNLATYLSRSLDSGILPALIPAAAAAGYARSYQIVIVPLTQLQLALGSAVLDRLSRGFDTAGNQDIAVSRKLWTLLQSVAFLSGIFIVLLAPLIQAVLFGPGWPMVNVMIAAMGCLLPSIATATYFTWTLQVESNGTQTAAHLFVMLVTPLVVIALAAAGGIHFALIGLVAGALWQSMALSVLHRKILPFALSRVAIRLVGVWAVMAALFFLVAGIAEFWAYEF